MALSQWLSVSRRGGGDFYTSNFTIPQGANAAHIELDVNPNDFATPDRTVTANIETSADGGQTWAHQMAVQWVGGQPSLKTGTWYAYLTELGAYAGLLIRVHFVTVGTFRWGLKGELL